MCAIDGAVVAYTNGIGNARLTYNMAMAAAQSAFAEARSRVEPAFMELRDYKISSSLHELNENMQASTTYLDVLIP